MVSDWNLGMAGSLTIACAAVLLPALLDCVTCQGMLCECGHNGHPDVLLQHMIATEVSAGPGCFIDTDLIICRSQEKKVGPENKRTEHPSRSRDHMIHLWDVRFTKRQRSFLSLRGDRQVTAPSKELFQLLEADVARRSSCYTL